MTVGSSGKRLGRVTDTVSHNQTTKANFKRKKFITDPEMFCTSKHSGSFFIEKIPCNRGNPRLRLQKRR